MRITYISSPGRGSQINITHGDEFIPWRVNDNTSTGVSPYSTTFDLINEVYEKFSYESQTKIFKLLGDIKALITEEFNIQALTIGLRKYFKELMDAHDYQFIRQFVSNDMRIIIPTKCVQDYIDTDEKPGSRDQTYLKKDYQDLVALILLIKPLIPIWIEYTQFTKGESGKNHREPDCWSLLSLSYVFDLPAVKKLEDYIYCFLKKNPVSLSTIVTGPGTEDYPGTVLANIIINKVALNDPLRTSTNANGQESNIITNIYYFVRAAANGDGAQRQASTVKEKKPEGGGNDVDRVSAMEGYRMQNQNSPGVTRAMQLEASNIELIVHRLFHGIDPFTPCKKKFCSASEIDRDLLDIFLSKADETKNRQVEDCQITITQYLLNSVLPAKAFPEYSMYQIINLIAIAQTLLWMEGQYLLAGIIGASADTDTESYVGGVTSRTRINAELLAKIDEHFPMATTVISQRTKQINPITKAIDTLNEELSRSEWILNLPPDMIEKITGHEHNRYVRIPPDIKVILANLIIKIASC